MDRNISLKLILILVLGGLALPLFIVLAQSDGSIPQEEKPTPITPEIIETASPATPVEPTPAETPAPTPATTTSVSAAAPEETGVRPTTSSPTTSSAVTPTPLGSVPETTETPIVTEQANNPLEEENTNPLLWIAIAALAVLPFGYFAAQSFKNKNTETNEENGDRCFDVKKLLDEKLAELTDLRGKLESKAKEEARNQIREGVKGTTAGELLALAEKAEKEYGRLKKLYEQCMIEFGGRKQVIIIHGCSSKPESPEERTFDKHWIPWIKKELSSKGVSVEAPLMPTPWEPSYERFKEEFSKYKITENTTLIGHSCGCAFLVRWLGESKQKIDKLILVAPWKIAREENVAKKAFYEYPIDETIKSRVKKIIMFTADNEEENGKKSLQMYHSVLGGEIIEIKGRGHYTFDEMGTEEFPELKESILPSK